MMKRDRSLIDEQARVLEADLSRVPDVASVVRKSDRIEVTVWSDGAARQAWKIADLLGIPESSLAIVRPIPFLGPYPGDDPRNHAARAEFVTSNIRRKGDDTTILLTSLEPVANHRSKLLVVGSMPGTISLERNEYYAHPQNRFWRLMDDIVHVRREEDYADRIDALLDRGIALWDVLKHCTRVGSLDRNIPAPSEVPNEFAGFLDDHPTIGTMLFNGRKAADAFRRHVESGMPERLRGRLEMHAMPSTSPANTRFNYVELLAPWRGRIGALP